MFDPIRAKSVAERLRENVTRARQGLPPLQAQPIFAGETRKRDGDIVLTNVGEGR